jgi:DNA-binding transcriptional ArsR family regulator
MQPNADRLNAAFAALADATRRGILARLVQGEATVNELVAPFGISQPAISRHLRVLEDAGLILRRVDGTRRPCRLAPSSLRELDDYLSMLRAGMENSYERLDHVLATMSQQREKQEKP